MEKLEKEESTFLSLCSPHDRDLLTGRIDMTLQDFERITYLTMALDYVESVSYTHLIYEIVSANGRKSYKIFSNEAELQEYLKKNKSKTCVAMTPIYQRSKYIEFNNSEIRRLNREEVEKYIREQKEEK